MSEKRSKTSKHHPDSVIVLDTLFQMLLKQRREIEHLQKQLQTQVGKQKSAAGAKRLIVIHLKNKTESVVMGLPQRVRATPTEVFPALSVMCLANALSASVLANNAFTHGEMKKYYDQFARAERALGAAIAFSTAHQVIGSISSAKGKISHAGRTYARKKPVLAFWRDNIDPKLSASRAATLIDEKYLSRSGEIAHATLCEWISAEKKKRARSS